MPRIDRRRALVAILLVGIGAWAPARAEDIPVPVNLQAELLFMIAGHDQNLAARAGSEVRTLIVTRPGDASARAAAQFRAAAATRDKVAGLPHTEELLSFTTAAALAEACKAKSASIVYLTPGFSEEDAAAIGQALEGGNVLSAAASPALVKKGVVLGFDLVSGRAKLLVDLTRAAKQRVSFSANVLGLMAVSK